MGVRATRWRRIFSSSRLVKPAPQWRIKDAWSRKAEKLHGISLEHLDVHGRPTEFISGIMNRELAGRTLYSDDPKYDRRWLLQLFDPAGVLPDFEISDTPARALLEDVARARDFDLEELERRLDAARDSRRHRAEADAFAYAAIWRGMTKTCD